MKNGTQLFTTYISFARDESLVSLNMLSDVCKRIICANLAAPALVDTAGIPRNLACRALRYASKFAKGLNLKDEVTTVCLLTRELNQPLTIGAYAL